MFKHILIPTDGSPVAAKAIKAGVALAKEMGASVTGFYAIEPPPTHLYGEGYLAERSLVEELERRSREVAQKSVDEITATAKSVGVPCDTAIGKAVVPYKGIIDAAEKNKCDAVFMASNGHRGLTGLLLGSVTHKVLTHSKIPVLVFR
ncbi:MAG TPA: universal stress protein [Burkholderiales bacterium]|jgi:nucleotide-binding universal stress UspA family protein